MGKNTFSRKNAEKFILVHRDHDDPRYYDNDAPPMVMVKVPTKSKHRDTAIADVLEEQEDQAREQFLQKLAEEGTDIHDLIAEKEKEEDDEFDDLEGEIDGENDGENEGKLGKNLQDFLQDEKPELQSESKSEPAETEDATASTQPQSKPQSKPKAGKPSAPSASSVTSATNPNPKRPAKRGDKVGEAAIYGVFFDDSNYDYTQHLRPIGQHQDAVFVERKTPLATTKKGGLKTGILFKEDLPKASPAPSKAPISASQTISDLLPEEVLPPTQTVRRTYQNQQNIPDAIAGFQPDMNPDLRQVLEALEDEAYIVAEERFNTAEEQAEAAEKAAAEKAAAEEAELDDDEMFRELLSGNVAAEELQDEIEYEEYDEFYDEDFDFAGLDSEEDFEEIGQIRKPKQAASAVVEVKEGEEEWEAHFRAFKQDAQKFGLRRNSYDSEDEFEDEEAGDRLGELPKLPGSGKAGPRRRNGGVSSVGSNTSVGTSASRRHRRRKMGTMTDLSAFSMSSSALMRNEGLTLLDDRFEKVEAMYNEEESDEEYSEFDMSKERNDLEDLMDEFLDKYDVKGKKLVVKQDEIQFDVRTNNNKPSKSARKKAAMEKMVGGFGGLSIK